MFPYWPRLLIRLIVPCALVSASGVSEMHLRHPGSSSQILLRIIVVILTCLHRVEMVTFATLPVLPINGNVTNSRRSPEPPSVLILWLMQGARSNACSLSISFLFLIGNKVC